MFSAGPGSAAISEPPLAPPVAAASTYRPDPYWQMDLANPVRRIGVYFALAFVFVRFSMIHEVAFFYTGRNLYLVVGLGVPCIAFTAISGGIRRTLHYRTS